MLSRKRDARIALRIKRKMKKKLLKLAKADNRTLSNLVLNILADWVAENCPNRESGLHR